MPGIKNMWKKSILFEIIDRRNPGIPVESFTLTIPPESMEVEEEQRISRTDTFGGVFIDDYGEGVKPIKISGHTGGSTLRETYSSGSTAASSKIDKSKKYNGREAFFYFRDHLMRYKSKKSVRNEYQHYDLRIYDLSLVPSARVMDKYAVETLSDAYECYLEKFKLTRNKERPLFYNYAIELTGIRSLGEYKERAPSPISTTRSPLSIIGGIRRGLRLTKGYFTTVENVMDQVTNVLDIVDELESQMKAFIHRTEALIYYPAVLASRAASMIKDLTNEIESSEDEIIVNQGKSELEYYEILSITRETQAGSDALVTFGKTPGAYGSLIRDISEESSRINSGLIRFEELSEEESEIVSNALDVSISEDKSYYIYGYIIVTTDQTTTLERLSLKHFGSLAFLDLIALFNGIEGDDEIFAGDIIKVPVVVLGKTPEDNLIYTTLRSDVYGSDKRLNAGGEYVIMASGDFARIEGIENFMQAINLRLNEKLGSRLRLTIYGIRDSIGFAMGEATPISYIISNIKDTLIQDPRVDSVDNIRLAIGEDIIQMSMNVYSIKVGEVLPFKGGIK